MIVLDTNVLSEVLRPVPSERVLSWLAAQRSTEVFITAITQAEILYGIEILPHGKRRTHLHGAVEALFATEFKGRILPFDEEPARIFSKIASGCRALGRPISQFDGMIAAISRSCGATLATRNGADFEHCGLRLIDPWEA